MVPSSRRQFSSVRRSRLLSPFSFYGKSHAAFFGKGEGGGKHAKAGSGGSDRVKKAHRREGLEESRKNSYLYRHFHFSRQQPEPVNHQGKRRRRTGGGGEREICGLLAWREGERERRLFSFPRRSMFRAHGLAGGLFSGLVAAMQPARQRGKGEKEGIFCPLFSSFSFLVRADSGFCPMPLLLLLLFCRAKSCRKQGAARIVFPFTMN